MSSTPRLDWTWRSGEGARPTQVASRPTVPPTPHLIRSSCAAAAPCIIFCSCPSPHLLERSHAMAWPWSPPPRQTVRFVVVVAVVLLLAAAPWPRAAAQTGYHVVSVSGTGANCRRGWSSPAPARRQSSGPTFAGSASPRGKYALSFFLD
jgi:hypothetical protein